MEIPTHELLKRKFKLWVVGPRLKEPRIHSCRVARDDVLVFKSGVVPQPCDLINIVVSAFLRVSADKPD